MSENKLNAVEDETRKEPVTSDDEDEQNTVPPPSPPSTPPPRKRNKHQCEEFFEHFNEEAKQMYNNIRDITYLTEQTIEFFRKYKHDTIQECEKILGTSRDILAPDVKRLTILVSLDTREEAIGYINTLAQAELTYLEDNMKPVNEREKSKADFSNQWNYVVNYFNISPSEAPFYKQVLNWSAPKPPAPPPRNFPMPSAPKQNPVIARVLPDCKNSFDATEMICNNHHRWYKYPRQFVHVYRSEGADIHVKNKDVYKNFKYLSEYTKIDQVNYLGVPPLSFLQKHKGYLLRFMYQFFIKDTIWDLEKDYTNLIHERVYTLLMYTASTKYVYQKEDLHFGRPIENANDVILHINDQNSDRVYVVSKLFAYLDEMAARAYGVDGADTPFDHYNSTSISFQMGFSKISKMNQEANDAEGMSDLYKYITFMIYATNSSSFYPFLDKESLVLHNQNTAKQKTKGSHHASLLTFHTVFDEIASVSLVDGTTTTFSIPANLNAEIGKSLFDSRFNDTDKIVSPILSEMEYAIRKELFDNNYIPIRDFHFFNPILADLPSSASKRIKKVPSLFNEFKVTDTFKMLGAIVTKARNEWNTIKDVSAQFDDPDVIADGYVSKHSNLFSDKASKWSHRDTNKDHWTSGKDSSFNMPLLSSRQLALVKDKLESQGKGTRHLETMSDAAHTLQAFLHKQSLWCNDNMSSGSLQGQRNMTLLINWLGTACLDQVNQWKSYTYEKDQPLDTKDRHCKFMLDMAIAMMTDPEFFPFLNPWQQKYYAYLYRERIVVTFDTDRPGRLRCFQVRQNADLASAKHEDSQSSIMTQVDRPFCIDVLQDLYPMVADIPGAIDPAVLIRIFIYRMGRQPNELRLLHHKLVFQREAQMCQGEFEAEEMYNQAVRKLNVELDPDHKRFEQIAMNKTISAASLNRLSYIVLGLMREKDLNDKEINRDVSSFTVYDLTPSPGNNEDYMLSSEDRMRYYRHNPRMNTLIISDPTILNDNNNDYLLIKDMIKILKRKAKEGFDAETPPAADKTRSQQEYLNHLKEKAQEYEKTSFKIYDDSNYIDDSLLQQAKDFIGVNREYKEMNIGEAMEQKKDRTVNPPSVSHDTEAFSREFEQYLQATGQNKTKMRYEISDRLQEYIEKLGKNTIPLPPQIQDMYEQIEKDKVQFKEEDLKVFRDLKDQMTQDGLGHNLSPSVIQRIKEQEAPKVVSKNSPAFENTDPKFQAVDFNRTTIKQLQDQHIEDEACAMNDNFYAFPAFEVVKTRQGEARLVPRCGRRGWIGSQPESGVEKKDILNGLNMHHADIREDTRMMLEALSDMIPHWCPTVRDIMFLWRWLGISCLGQTGRDVVTEHLLYSDTNKKLSRGSYKPKAFDKTIKYEKLNKEAQEKDREHLKEYLKSAKEQLNQQSVGKRLSPKKRCYHRFLFLLQIMDSGIVFPFFQDQMDAEAEVAKNPGRIHMFLSWDKSGEVLFMRYTQEKGIETKPFQVDQEVVEGSWVPHAMRLKAFRMFAGGLMMQNIGLYRRWLKKNEKDPNNLEKIINNSSCMLDPERMTYYIWRQPLDIKTQRTLDKIYDRYMGSGGKPLTRNDLDFIKTKREESFYLTLRGFTSYEIQVLRELWKLEPGTKPISEWEGLLKTAYNRLYKVGKEKVTDQAINRYLCSEPEFVNRVRAHYADIHPELSPEQIRYFTRDFMCRELVGVESIDVSAIPLEQLTNVPDRLQFTDGSGFMNLWDDSYSKEMDTWLREHYGVTLVKMQDDPHNKEFEGLRARSKRVQRASEIRQIVPEAKKQEDRKLEMLKFRIDVAEGNDLKNFSFNEDNQLCQESRPGFSCTPATSNMTVLYRTLFRSYCENDVRLTATDMLYINNVYEVLYTYNVFSVKQELAAMGKGRDAVAFNDRVNRKTDILARKCNEILYIYGKLNEQATSTKVGLPKKVNLRAFIRLPTTQDVNRRVLLAWNQNIRDLQARRPGIPINVTNLQEEKNVDLSVDQWPPAQKPSVWWNIFQSGQKNTVSLVYFTYLLLTYVSVQMNVLKVT